MKNEIGRPGTKPFRIKELKEEIAKTYHALDILEESFEKEIPLKLNRNFTESQIKLPNGVLFDTEQSKDLINAYFGQNNAAYLIKGVMQRKNEEYILVATDNNTLIEVPMSKILDYYKKANTAPIVKKEVPPQKTPEYAELKKIIADRAELQKLETKKKELEQQVAEIEEKERIEKLTDRFDAKTLLRPEIKSRLLRGLFEKLKDKQPELINMTIKEATRTLILRADIKFHKLDGWLSSTGTAHVEIPLVNGKGDTLITGQHVVRGALKSQIESSMPSVIPGIKKLFEDRRGSGEAIENIKIEDGKILVLFKDAQASH